MSDAGLFFADILICPVCRGKIACRDGRWWCQNAACVYAGKPFLTCAGQPVFIDFATSIFRPEEYGAQTPVIAPAKPALGSVAWISDRLAGRNEAAARAAETLRARLQGVDAPLLLIVGGGAVGSGAESLYEDKHLRLIGTDVYPSPATQIVADGHRLPFADGSIDAVWVQAVLEHVLEPHVVAAEIHRVLKPGGLVYADTPFMQQVHMAAYDFHRFTASGHRWLFRNFTQIEAGVSVGAGSALNWSLRYFARALGGGRIGAKFFELAFFWLRFFDGWTQRRPNLDAAAGVYFFGVKADRPIAAQDMPAYYETLAKR